MTRIRQWQLALWLAVVALLTWAEADSTGDWPLFSRSASQLVHHGLHIYADNSSLQAGPVAILLVALLAVLGPTLALLLAQVLSAALGLAVAVGGGLLGDHRDPHRATGGLTATSAVALVAGALVMGAWGSLSGFWVHIDDAMALAAVGAAAVMVARGRPLAAGVLVGLGLGCKPIAVVALPMLLAVSHRRRRSLAAAVAVAAAAWLPFVIADRHTLGAASRPFPIDVASAVHALGLHQQHAPSWLRAVQLGAALALAALAARRRGWLWAPAAGLLGRLLLDPAVFDYYVAGALLVLLFAELADARLPWRTVVAYLGLWTLPSTSAGYGWVRLVVLTGLLVEITVPEVGSAVARWRRRARTSAAEGATPPAHSRWTSGITTTTP